MTQMDLFQTATSSPQDTHANHFHLPGSAEAVKMTDISGHTFFPLLKPSDPLGAFTKMFMATSLWASAKCYLTWKGKATPQGHSLFQLVPLTHLTDETEFGSSPEMWATPSASDSQGTTGGNQGKSLRTDVRMWPTPRASSAMAANLTPKLAKRADDYGNLEEVVARTMWPTPTARDYKDSGENMNLYRNERQNTQLGVVAKRSEPQRVGSLNPQWVEWLMGYPEGWTDLKD